MTDAEKFWSLVEKSDGCWLWRGVLMVRRRGYGTFYTSANGRKPAHRYSWFFAHGEMPPRNIDVCHACDVPQCVRPDHLFLGTRLDNMLDAQRKGRMQRGEARPNAKLTVAKVIELMRLRSEGYTYRRLAHRYNVSQSAIVSVLKGNSWRAA